MLITNCVDNDAKSWVIYTYICAKQIARLRPKWSFFFFFSRPAKCFKGDFFGMEILVFSARLIGRLKGGFNAA